MNFNNLYRRFYTVRLSLLLITFLMTIALLILSLNFWLEVESTRKYSKQAIDNSILQEKINKAAMMATFNLLANRICEQCGDKSDITRLSICGSCALAWYCSKECQEKHWPTHKLRCCKKDGPLNKGYQAMAICKMKD